MFGNVLNLSCGDQFPNSWNWDTQTPGSGICRLSLGKLALRFRAGRGSASSPQIGPAPGHRRRFRPNSTGANLRTSGIR